VCSINETLSQPHLAHRFPIRERIKLHTELHPTTNRDELCLGTKYARYNLDPMELLVNHLSLHLEHPTLEYPSNAATDKERLSKDMVGYIGLSDESQVDDIYGLDSRVHRWEGSD
jgi:hypothetical protein